MYDGLRRSSEEGIMDGLSNVVSISNGTLRGKKEESLSR